MVVELFDFFCVKYKTQIEELNAKLVQKTKEYKDRGLMIEALHLDLARADDRVYEERLKTQLTNIKLTRLLASSIQIPDIAPNILSAAFYDPWNDPTTSGLDPHIADSSYYKYTKADWQKILGKCYAEVKRAQVRWTQEVGDCDNWAESMHYVVQKATHSAGLDHQSAIAIAWSDSHAYNLFFSSNGVYVYEPQTGEIKGKLGEVPEPWITKRLFFIG